MIQIYLCEDNPQQLQYFTKIIKDYLLFHELNAEFCYAADNPGDLLQHLEMHPPKIGMYFLDICLDAEMNGLQLAVKIRETDPFGEIIFITSKSEMCFLSFQYQVKALDFILKDDMELLPQKILKCLKTADKTYQQMMEHTKEPYYIKLNGKRNLLNPDDILYIETSKETAHQIIIHTLCGITYTHGTLKEILVSLENYTNFSKCHQSTIVNTRHIENFDKAKKQLILSNNEICNVSVRYLKNFSLYNKNYP